MTLLHSPSPHSMIYVSVPFLQSPDGDLIDCVLSHQQPAFDHPLLRGQRPLVISSNSTQGM